ncbi:MAG: hypothetical protein GXO91_01045 [FCB group bacterium]|nr:hypothetical protein [FCB group bacterium]
MKIYIVANSEMITKELLNIFPEDFLNETTLDADLFDQALETVLSLNSPTNMNDTEIFQTVHSPVLSPEQIFFDSRDDKK